MESDWADHENSIAGTSFLPLRHLLERIKRLTQCPVNAFTANWCRWPTTVIF